MMLFYILRKLWAGFVTLLGYMLLLGIVGSAVVTIARWAVPPLDGPTYGELLLAMIVVGIVALIALRDLRERVRRARAIDELTRTRP